MKIGSPAFGVVVEDTSNRSLLPPGPVKPYAPVDQNTVISEFGKRLAGLESAVKLSVPADRVTSAIALTKDTVLISSDKIAVLGEVTFADWRRDLNGQSTGQIDPSITQIRGGVIRTEKVVSFDGLSWLDLDATGTTPFIQCRDTVSIRANGAFTFGSTSGKQLTWDGTNLTVGSSSLLGSTPVSTVVSYANDVPNKLAKSGTDILSGQVSFQSSGAFVVGTPTIDGSGNVTGGTGLAFTSKGIVGISAGAVKFSISTTGNAVFAGDIDTGGVVRSVGSTTSGVYNAAIVGEPANTSNIGVIGSSQNSYGLLGLSSSSYGIYGRTATGTGVYAESTNGSYGVKAYVTGGLGGYAVYAVNSVLGVGVYGEGNNHGVYSKGPFTCTGNAQFNSNLITSSFMNYSSPSNIIVFETTGTPTNTTTPVVWLKVRTLGSSSPYYIPAYS